LLQRKPLSHYRHILWDWNGTLLDDAALSVEIMNGLLNQYGKPGLLLKRYQQIFDFPVRNYYQALGFDFSVTPFERVGGEFMEAYHRRWRQCRLQQHADEVLQQIKETGVPQSVLSAAATSLVEQGLSHFGLYSFFDRIHGLDHHYADGKLELAQAFMAEGDWPPESVVLIGDTTHDYQVAHAVGMDCILFTGGHQSRTRLQACGVSLCSSLRELTV
jgi:phosphoglycolate phosphatase